MKTNSYNYDNYGAFKESAAQPPRSRIEHIARALGLKNRYLRFLKTAARDKPVLEIGCGNGQFIQEMLNEGFTTVTGVEPSSSYQFLVDPGLIIKEFASDYLENCTASSIGTIVALDVFEHIPIPELRVLLRLIHDRLIPGGIVMFRVPNMASPTAMPLYFGDLSHVTALSEVSIKQFIFDSGFTLCGVHAEPFAYPRSLATLVGVLAWPLYKGLMHAVLAAFGIRSKILTPNLVCILRKSENS